MRQFLYNISPIWKSYLYTYVGLCGGMAAAACFWNDYRGLELKIYGVSMGLLMHLANYGTKVTWKPARTQRGFVVVYDNGPGIPPLFHDFKMTKLEVDSLVSRSINEVPEHLRVNLRAVPAACEWDE